MEDKPSGAGVLYLFLTFFLWGSVYVAGKLGSAQMSPFLLAALRCGLAAPLLLLLAHRHLHIKIERADYKHFLILGVLGYYMTIDLVQLGIHFTGASTAALVNSFNPVAIMLLAAALLRERITPIKLVCLLLAVTGTVVVAGGAHGKRELIGILASLLATVTWGAAAVAVRTLTARYPAIFVTACGMVLSLSLHIPTGIVAALRQPPRLDASGALTVLYLAVVGSALSQITWAKALSQFPAGTCSLFYPLQAVFSALLGAVILNERFHSSFFVGLILIAADVALSTWATKRDAEASARSNL